MALVLNGTSQYVSRTNPVSAMPFTIAGWSRAANVTSNHVCWTMFEAYPSNCLYGGLMGAVASDPARTDVFPTSAAPGTATTSTSYSANTWHHVASVFTSASSFATLLDGGGKGTNSGNYTGTFGNLATLAFGVYWTGAGSPTYFQGDHAEWGVWSVALTDGEVESLAKGYSPLDVRPLSLVAYYPFGGHCGRNARDRWKSKYDLTASNSPTYTDHPRVIYPTSPNLRSKGVAPPSTKYWLFGGKSARLIGGGLGG